VIQVTTAQPSFDEYLAWLETARGKGQVHYDTKQEVWQVLGHPEAGKVMSDPAAFSSDLSSLRQGMEDLDLFSKGNIVQMDPPRHRQFRGLVSQAFTPKVVAGLAPRIEQITHELLDATEGGRFDLVDELTYPLPVIVIAELLGIPVSDRDVFRRWADGLFSQVADPEQSVMARREEAVAAMSPLLREMNDYLLDFVRGKRAGGGEDLTAQLVRAEVDGEHLDDQEIVDFVAILLIAGHITTTATLGNAVVSFDEHRDAVAEVRANPELLPQAIEEVLRHRTPFPRVARTTTADVELGGEVIPKGQIVIPSLTAANRDERVFADPNGFDIHRKPNPHLTFGHGIHFCLGAPLARLEAKIALRIMLERYTDIAVADDAPVEYRNPWVMVGVTKLPLDVS
jgi:cytochrome P450